MTMHAIDQTGSPTALLRRYSQPRTHRDALPFVMFLLLNVALFIRPSELIPAFENVPIYEMLMICCLITSGAAIYAHLGWSRLRVRPIIVFVLGIEIAALLSHLSHGRLSAAVEAGVGFAKVVAYLLLLATIVSSGAKLRMFLLAVSLLVLAMAVLAILQYHGILHIQALVPYSEVQDWKGSNGDAPFVMQRLVGAGLFNDPNDFCLSLVFAAMLCFYFGSLERRLELRLAWVLAVGVFGYALLLTGSRGGILAAMSAGMSLLGSTWGWRKTLSLSVVVVLLLSIVYQGRQAQMSLSDGTGHDRIVLWSDGFMLLRQSPVFGTGMDTYADEVGLVAHNSVVHAYVELGLIGGTAFVGAFVAAFEALMRKGGDGARRMEHGDLRRLRPYLLASLVAYTCGYLSLSRAYSIPTYTMLGAVAAYSSIAARECAVNMGWFNGKLVLRSAGIGVAMLGGCYVVVRLFR